MPPDVKQTISYENLLTIDQALNTLQALEIPEANQDKKAQAQAQAEAKLLIQLIELRVSAQLQGLSKVVNPHKELLEEFRGLIYQDKDNKKLKADITSDNDKFKQFKASFLLTAKVLNEIVYNKNNSLTRSLKDANLSGVVKDSTDFLTGLSNITTVNDAEARNAESTFSAVQKIKERVQNEQSILKKHRRDQLITSVVCVGVGATSLIGTGNFGGFLGGAGSAQFFFISAITFFVVAVVVLFDALVGFDKLGLSKVSPESNKLGKVNEIELLIIQQLEQDMKKNYSLKGDVRDLGTKGVFNNEVVYKSAQIAGKIDQFLKKDTELAKAQDQAQAQDNNLDELFEYNKQNQDFVRNFDKNQLLDQGNKPETPAKLKALAAAIIDGCKKNTSQYTISGDVDGIYAPNTPNNTSKEDFKAKE